MANNEYVNKVLFGNTTVMDISDTTAETEDVIEGQVFYTKSGAPAVGSLGDATTSTHGLMSVEDKVKLDNINEIQINKTLDTSAAIMSFSDGTDDLPMALTVEIEPVQDLHGYDSPWPAGGGKNKAQLIEDGYVPSISNGQLVPASGCRTDYIKVAPSTSYVFSYSATASNTIYWLFYDSNKSFLRYGSSNDNPKSIVISSDAEYVMLRTSEGLSSFSWFQMETGTEASAYQPYSNICPISGFDSVKVTRTGKNLSSVELLAPTAYWGSSYAVLVALINSLPVGTYTLSHKATVLSIPDSGTIMHGPFYVTAMVNGSQVPVSKYMEIPDNLPSVGKVYEDSTTFTITETNKGKCNHVYSYCDSSVHTGTGRGNYQIYNIQIELGSTATAYEPYHGNTYDIEFPSEAGTVYGGTLDVVTGELVVDRAGVDLGTLTWRYNYGNLLAFDTADIASSVAGGNNIVCSQYKLLQVILSTAIINANDMFIRINKSIAGERESGTFTNGAIVIKDTNYSDAAAFKAAMSGVQLVYKIAEPQTYHLTPQEITTLLGQNNIWADTGDINSVTYSKLTSGLINTYDKVKLDSLAAVALEDATQSTHGLMSATDKIKLDGIDLLGVKLNTTTLTPDANGYVYIPLMTGATSSTAGAIGLVPAPNIGDENKYLKADGTWDTNVVFLDYNVSTWNDFLTAYNAGKNIYCKVLNTTNEWRIVPLIYISLNNGGYAEFHYYRSRDITSGYVPDEVHVYKLTRNGNVWETTVRLINFSLATTSAPGLLEAADKTKLNKIDVSNNHFSVRGDIYMECDAEFLNGQKVASENYVDTAVSNAVISSGSGVSTPMVGASASLDGAAGLVPAPQAGDQDKFLAGDGTFKSGGLPMVILSYGNSTWSDFINAYNNNVIVYCRASSNSNPASGSQTRMAFMAYVNNSSSPTEVEFQYYRSVSSHNATQMGDQVFVYKLNNKGAWSVTTREASIKQIKVDSNDPGTVSWNNNVITLKSGLPKVSSADEGKILKVVNGVWTAVDP